MMQLGYSSTMASYEELAKNGVRHAFRLHSLFASLTVPCMP